MSSGYFAKSKKLQGIASISPALVFLGFYLGFSLFTGDFYAMPLTVALAIASAAAILTLRGRTLNERIAVFSAAAGQKNILYMIWIFILAGAFAAVAKSMGAVEATVRLTLLVFPPDFMLPAIFVSACLISMSIGTSVGTVVALTPLVSSLAELGGESVALYVAAVLGGAFFGDNMSFISDTTIAATRTQGCQMKDKFKANLKIALPAAIFTIAVYTFMGLGSQHVHEATAFTTSDLRLVVPYISVIVLAAAGVNVIVVLSSGILLAILCSVPFGMPLLEITSSLGVGIDSMGNLVIITLLACGMLGVIKETGGIDYLLNLLSWSKLGKRGAQFSMAWLTATVNMCTANNTIAILTTGSICREIAVKYGIEPKRAASLLDSSSCIMQCLIPYGAQTLLATGIAGISPGAPWPYLVYPWALALCLVLSIAFGRTPRKTCLAS